MRLEVVWHSDMHGVHFICSSHNLEQMLILYVQCAPQVANLSIEAAGDGREWGWRTVEVPQATASTIPATSVPALLREFNLSAFDYAKIDIEGAEFAVFKGDSAVSWLSGAKVPDLEHA